MTRQSQKGGEGSNNFQAQEMVVQVGIDEKRAREVFQEMNLQLRKEYTQEALEVANARVSEFENSLMPKMERVEGALEAFADPSFQLLLVEAQKQLRLPKDQQITISCQSCSSIDSKKVAIVTLEQG